MDSNKKLLDDLAQAAYDSGYYSGKREDGQPHHLAAIERRRWASDRILQRLAAVSDLLAALERMIDVYEIHFKPLPEDKQPRGAYEQARVAIAGAKERSER